jgi:hypothetical protein
MLLRGKEVLSSWGNDKEIVSVRDAVSRTIAKELNWPNGFFIPDDPCSILFFDPSPNLDAARAIMEIEKMYGKSDALGQIPLIKFGDLISQLMGSRRN